MKSSSIVKEMDQRAVMHITVEAESCLPTLLKEFNFRSAVSAFTAQTCEHPAPGQVRQQDGSRLRLPHGAGGAAHQ